MENKKSEGQLSGAMGLSPALPPLAFLLLALLLLGLPGGLLFRLHLCSLGFTLFFFRFSFLAALFLVRPSFFEALFFFLPSAVSLF